MGRAPCCDSVGLKKGPWTAEEDQKLLAYIKDHGHGSWRSLPAKAGLLRCGKSCRLRWTNYLRPDIKRGKFSLQEEQIIIQFHALLGNRWSAIAAHLPQRTDNEIKNYWNTHLKKRLARMGIDPATHKRKCETLVMPDGGEQSSLSHMAQWESARLEAEARLARESNLSRTGLGFPSLPLASPPGPYSPLYSSTGNHLDMVKLRTLLLRTRSPPNPSRAAGHAATQNQPLNSFPYSELAGGSMAAEEPCVLDEYSLPLPNLPCTPTALSFSEELEFELEGAKSLDEISSSACDHDGLLDLSSSEDDHMSRDYWSNILDMVGSPLPQTTFF